MRTCGGMLIAAAAAFVPATPVRAEPAEAVMIDSAGSIEDSDRHDTPEGPVIHDAFPLRLEAGRRYRISASSNDFDSVIALYQRGETEPVAFNDDFDSEGSLDSRLNYTAEQTDDYELQVRGYSSDQRGAYRVRVERLPPLPPPVTAASSTGAQLRWQVWEGELSESDAEMTGAYFDDHRVRLQAGRTYFVFAEAEAFDPMVWILRADARGGEPLTADNDSGGARQTVLHFLAGDDADYIVRMSSLGNGETGRYRLRVSDALTPPPLAPSAEPSAASAD